MLPLIVFGRTRLLVSSFYDIVVKCQGREEAPLFAVLETKSLIVDRLHPAAAPFVGHFFHISLLFFISNTESVTWEPLSH